MTINRLNRRDFLKAAGLTTATIAGSSILSACNSLGGSSKASLGRVVIIGGGYAGTTAA